MQCETVRELMEAYALGALSRDDMRMVESHLTRCVECRTLADEYVSIAAEFPRALAAASAAALPSALKTRVLNAALAGDAPRATQPRTSTQATARPPFAWLNLRAVGALIALVLVVSALAWALQLNTALAQERALRAEYANLVGQQEIVLEVIDSNKTSKVLLRSPSGGPSYGKLYTRPDLSHVVVMAARLPVPAAGEVYQLWLTQQSGSQLAGTLNINDQGFGLIVFDAPQNGPTYRAAQLIRQPGGSSTPDGVVVLSWQAQ